MSEIDEEIKDWRAIAHASIRGSRLSDEMKDDIQRFWAMYVRPFRDTSMRPALMEAGFPAPAYSSHGHMTLKSGPNGMRISFGMNGEPFPYDMVLGKECPAWAIEMVWYSLGNVLAFFATVSPQIARTSEKYVGIAERFDRRRQA